MTDRTPIIVERTIGAPAERVWRALTDGAVMPKWFFEQIREFRPDVGFETQFVVHNEGKDYRHHWRVTESIANRKLVYDWLYPPLPGASVVAWELTPNGDRTN